jgi:hypothetical protein
VNQRRDSQALRALGRSRPLPRHGGEPPVSLFLQVARQSTRLIVKPPPRRAPALICAALVIAALGLGACGAGSPVSSNQPAAADTPVGGGAAAPTGSDPRARPQAIEPTAGVQGGVQAGSVAGGAPVGDVNAHAPPLSQVRHELRLEVIAAPVTNANYIDPLRFVSVWERTDQGVDAAMAPGSPLLAFAPSIVRMIVGDFYAGQPAIVFEVTGGPLAGRWWYLSEQITPRVSQGQTIGAGQTVATYASAGTGIEIGWWMPRGGYPLGHPGYREGLATNAGGDFRYLLRALGANPGTGAGLSTGPTIGNADYPTANPGP